MELTSVPGVGEKTADALTELANPEEALASGDVARLARAPGISEGRAAQIARGAIRARHDDPGGWAATDRAKEIHTAVLELVQQQAVTSYAEKRLETLYPSAVPERITEVREWVRGALDREPDPAVREALAGVEPLEPPAEFTVRDRALVTTDAQQYAEMDAAFPEVPVEIAEDNAELAELARSYPTVIAVDETFAGLDVPGDVQMLPDALDQPAEVVPERPLAFLAANADRLRAAAAVHDAAGIDPPCSVEKLDALLDRVDEDGQVVGDAELNRLRDAADDVETAAATAASVANDHLRDAIRERDVRIEGQDFLSLVEQGARVDSLLSRELADEFDEAIQRARDHLADAARLNADERPMVERVFGGEPTFPVEVNDEPLSRLRTELKAARDRRAARLKADAAADIGELRPELERLVKNALQLDVELAVARFARTYDCRLPAFTDPAIDNGVAGDEATAGDAGDDAMGDTRDGSTDDAHGDATGDTRDDVTGDTHDDVTDDAHSETAGGLLQLDEGRSPLLDVSFEATEPVTYAVRGVRLLSGVNSGGKTSTLDLLALTATLAHMGLPVPAVDCRLSRFSGLHYYAKSQGTLDAGAFESTVREFGELVSGPDNRLVLVDELESITEPGASAKIIAGILERLAAGDATAVFVSHMAREISDTADFDVGVDGIEAVGLEDGELVVNRSPQTDHLARSTPELIVEKLADETDESFYDELLEKF